jgi:hypothetical protein
MALMVSPTAKPTAIYAPSQTVAIAALHKDSLYLYRGGSIKFIERRV